MHALASYARRGKLIAASGLAQISSCSTVSREHRSGRILPVFKTAEVQSQDHEQLTCTSFRDVDAWYDVLLWIPAHYSARERERERNTKEICFSSCQQATNITIINVADGPVVTLSNWKFVDICIGGDIYLVLTMPYVQKCGQTNTYLTYSSLTIYVPHKYSLQTHKIDLSCSRPWIVFYITRVIFIFDKVS